MRPRGSQDPSEGSLVLIGIEPEILRRDPPLGRDGGRLEDHQSGARERQLADVDHVPVAGRAVLRGVLAHGRYDDPVLQAQLADGELFEQTAHDHALQFEIEKER